MEQNLVIYIALFMMLIMVVVVIIYPKLRDAKNEECKSYEFNQKLAQSETEKYLRNELDTAHQVIGKLQEKQPIKDQWLGIKLKQYEKR